jgi:hypothetical protein
MESQFNSEGGTDWVFTTTSVGNGKPLRHFGHTLKCLKHWLQDSVLALGDPSGCPQLIRETAAKSKEMKPKGNSKIAPQLNGVQRRHKTQSR